MRIAAIGCVLYAIVGGYVFLVNVNTGPVSFGLSLVRGALWPLWFAGRLEGQREPMD